MPSRSVTTPSIALLSLAVGAAVVAMPLEASARAGCRLLHWKRLQPGVSYATVSTKAATTFRLKVRDERLHIVRIDPRKAKLVALVASERKEASRTAGRWVDGRGLVAAINLGMYQRDLRTHVGYLRRGKHLNSRRWVRKYRSLLAFGAAKGVKGAGEKLLFADLDRPIAQRVLSKYAVVTQNLRLIKSRDGRTAQAVWSKQPKRWSEAALALDRKGRLLMLFTRMPLTMWEFNRFILALPLGVVRAMHLEGGPEASLSLRAKGLNLDLAGSYETGFVENDSNVRQWSLPNILGVVGKGRGRKGDCGCK